MKIKRKIKLELFAAVCWLILGQVLLLAVPENIFFVLVLGAGVFYSVYILSQFKTNKKP